MWKLMITQGDSRGTCISCPKHSQKTKSIPLNSLASTLVRAAYVVQSYAVADAIIKYIVVFTLRRAAN